MPHVRRDVTALMKLYRRCRDFSTLPRAGGVFDQDERVMEILEFIDGELAKWKARRAEEQQGEIMKQQMLKGLPRG